MIYKTSNMLSSIPSLQDDEEDVSYDVESLFTNIPQEQTINSYHGTNLSSEKVETNLLETGFQKIVDKTCYRIFL